MANESKAHEGFVPAEEMYNKYARYYDTMTVRHVADLPLYQQIVASKPPPYLEVGCGTGRVLSHLLSRKPDTTQGHYLTGVDVSEEMLAICAEKTSSFINDKSLHLMKHDFSLRPLQKQKFHAALVTFFTFNYIPEHLQANFLANIGESLYQDGIIVLDCFYPYLKWHPEKGGEWVDKGPVIMGETHIGFQEKAQMVTPSQEQREWIFTEPNGTTKRITTNRVYVSPEKGKTLLESTGFTDIRRVSDYKIPGSHDFTEDSRGYNFVLTARKL